MTPAPLLTALNDLDAELARAGFAVLEAAAVAALASVPVAPLRGWHRFSDDLPSDNHLRDGGRFRRRRHGCFVVDGTRVEPAPHGAHWQPVEYNALHVGIERWFEPLAPALLQDPAWHRLLSGLAGVASALRPGVRCWFVEARTATGRTGSWCCSWGART